MFDGDITEAERYTAKRTGLFHTSFAFPGMYAERLRIIKLMVEVWVNKNLNYEPIHLNNFLYFDESGHRDDFESYLKGINTHDVPRTLVPTLNLEEILDAQDLITLAKVPYPGIYNGVDHENFARDHKELALWLVERTIKPTAGKRIWYDRARECFIFEDPALATNFKLKFTPDGAKPKKKLPQQDPHTGGVTPKDLDMIKKFKEEMMKEYEYKHRMEEEIRRRRGNWYDK